MRLIFEETSGGHTTEWYAVHTRPRGNVVVSDSYISPEEVCKSPGQLGPLGS